MGGDLALDDLTVLGNHGCPGDPFPALSPQFTAILNPDKMWPPLEAGPAFTGGLSLCLHRSQAGLCPHQLVQGQACESHRQFGSFLFIFPQTLHNSTVKKMSPQNCSDPEHILNNPEAYSQTGLAKEWEERRLWLALAKHTETRRKIM